MSVWSTLFMLVTMAAALGFVLRGFDPRPQRLPAAFDSQGLERRQDRFHTPAPMTRRDVLPLLALVLVYGAVAFLNLGNRESPVSWQHFTEKGQQLTLTLLEPCDVSRVQLFTGPDTGEYTLEYSADGVSWSEPALFEQGYADILKWQDGPLPPDPAGIRQLRVTARSGPLRLGELAVRDGTGALAAFSGQSPLTDEQDTVPAEESYLHSSYFDEIYHARTAWEHLENVPPYEITHPPLGKLILALGIRLFGMTPFGWRFSGALFGVLMLPILYVFLKNLFGRTLVAFSVTAVFAFDFMHFTQTRIATIDTYCVFFILLMYYFFYRYYTQPYDAPLRRTLWPLFLSGLCFGLGAASKWTVIFGGGGLALIWCLRQGERLRWGRVHGRRGQVTGYLLPTVLWSCVFFLLVPALIYLLAYIPYGRAAGVKLLSTDYLRVITGNLDYMYSYHAGLEATHPYQSPWWKWVLDVRPILYYLQSYPDGLKSAFGAFGNPLFWWTGLGAMVCMAVKAVRGDKLALFILVGYLSALLPWVFVTRCAFIYHYFPSTVFLALALGRMCSDLCQKSKTGWDWSVPALAGACAALFAVFYPALSGLPVPAAYGSTLLRWFAGSWPF